MHAYKNFAVYVVAELYSLCYRIDKKEHSHLCRKFESVMKELTGKIWLPSIQEEEKLEGLKMFNFPDFYPDTVSLNVLLNLTKLTQLFEEVDISKYVKPIFYFEHDPFIECDPLKRRNDEEEEGIIHDEKEVLDFSLKRLKISSEELELLIDNFNNKQENMLVCDSEVTEMIVEEEEKFRFIFLKNPIKKLGESIEKMMSIYNKEFIPFFSEKKNEHVILRNLSRVVYTIFFVVFGLSSK